MLNRVRKGSGQERGEHGGPAGNNRSERPSVTVEDLRTAGEGGLLGEIGVAYGSSVAEVY